MTITVNPQGIATLGPSTPETLITDDYDTVPSFREPTQDTRFLVLLSSTARLNDNSPQPMSLEEAEDAAIKMTQETGEQYDIVEFIATLGPSTPETLITDDYDTVEFIENFKMAEESQVV